MLTVLARDVTLPLTRIDASGTIVLTVTGDVDAQRVRAVHRGVIDALRRHQPSEIQLNLHGCARIDKAGVRGLRLCRADAAQLDCRLTLVRVPAAMRPALHGSGFIETRHGER